MVDLVICGLTEPSFSQVVVVEVPTESVVQLAVLVSQVPPPVPMPAVTPLGSQYKEVCAGRMVGDKQASRRISLSVPRLIPLD